MEKEKRERDDNRINNINDVLALKNNENEK